MIILNYVIHEDVMPRLLTISEKRYFAVGGRRPDEAVGAVAIVGVFGAVYGAWPQNRQWNTAFAAGLTQHPLSRDVHQRVQVHRLAAR